MYAYGVEAVLTTCLQEPGFEGRCEFAAVQIVYAQPFFPGFAIVVLLPQMGMQVVYSEAQKRIPLGRYEPPSFVFFYAEEARCLKFFARPASVLVAFGGVPVRFMSVHLGTFE